MTIIQMRDVQPDQIRAAKNGKLYLHHAGRRVSLRTENYMQAMANVMAMEVEGVWPFAEIDPMRQSQARSVTFNDVMDFYVKEKRRNAPASTIRKLTGGTARTIRHYLGDIKMKDLSAKHVKDYALARSEGEKGIGTGRGVSDRTISLEFDLIYAAMRLAMSDDDGPLEENYKLPKRPVKVRPSKVDRKVLTEDEIRAVFGALENGPRLENHEEVAAWCRLAFTWGARHDALIKLTANQINWHTRRVNLLPDGEKQTKKVRPVVPIYDSIAPLLRDLETKALQRRSGRLFTMDRANAYLKTLGRRAGLSRPLTPHMFRHSCITYRLGQGQKPKSIATLVGLDLQTLYAAYTHYFPIDNLADDGLSDII